MIIRKRAECWIIQNDKIWVGIKNGKITIPGGTWEQGETLKETAIRETKEEIGVTAKNLRLLCKDLIVKDAWSGWTHAQTYSYQADFGGIDESLLGNGPEGSFHRALIPVNRVEDYFKKMLNSDDYFKDIAEQNLWIIRRLKND